MKSLAVDVAIIGAGTAGLAAYRAAKAAGATVLLVESGEGGTTCASVGCMPSKLLIAAADAAHAASAASTFGICVEGSIRVDGRAVMDRVRRERDRFVNLVLRDVDALPNADRIAGRARFVDDTTVDIGNHTRVTCKSVVISTGSRADRPAFLSDLGELLITSDDVFAWEDLPSAVAVIGPGAIGLELGQALHRLGVRVVLLGKGGDVGPLRDPAVLARAIAVFQDEFILEPDAHIGSTAQQGHRVVLHRPGKHGAGTPEYFDLVLAATGRTPNVDDLGLAHTSIQLDTHGVPLSHPTTCRALSDAPASPIFVAGDASQLLPVLHEASDAGTIAGENAARFAHGHAVQTHARRAPLSIVFTDPQIALVGGGFAALVKGSYATGRVDFADQGRSRVLAQNRGLLHVYGNVSDGKFLGAEMVAPAAEHLAHLLAWALQSKLTVEQMLRMPFYHPTIEEGLRTALRDLERHLQRRQS